MIRPEDFQIRIGQSCSATYVQVTHKPTGKTRSADQAHGESVNEARERLIRQLTGEVHVAERREPPGDRAPRRARPDGLRRRSPFRYSAWTQATRWIIATRADTLSSHRTP